MNKAWLNALNNSELVELVEYDDNPPADVVQELVKRFVALVNNGTIDDSPVDFSEQDHEDDDRIDELRGAIAEAISVLESV